MKKIEDKNKQIVLTIGKEKTTVARPEITIIATIFVPIKRPKTYLIPDRNPNADPIPAVDKTPGPGVINKKNTAKENIIKVIVLKYRNFRNIKLVKN